MTISRRLCSLLALICLQVSAVVAWSQTTPQRGVDEEDLRPGLVATYRDNAGRQIMQLEPTIAQALQAGEAPHPRLAADGGTARWEGYLKTPRAGTYQFRAIVRGRLRLTIDGKEILLVNAQEEKPVEQTSADTRLESGVHRLTAEFTRLPGPARLELLWQAPYFRREPLSFDHLAHLPKDVPAQVAVDREADFGRYVVEEHNCTACHRPADGDKLAGGLVKRQGPDLSQVGRRAEAGWMFHWLGDPQQMRPGAVMPRMFSDDANSRVERYAVAEYLSSLNGLGATGNRRANRQDERASERRGEKLYATVGCVVCHGTSIQFSEGSAVQAVDKKENPAAESFIPRSSSIPVVGLGSKTSPERLAAYLQNPLAVDPSGRMPHMQLQGNEAQDLARFLCTSRLPQALTDLLATPTAEQLLAAFRRVEPRPDEVPAFRKLSAQQQRVDLGKRLVIDKGCNNCHTIAPGGKPFASVFASATFNDIKKKPTAGCLAEEAKQRDKAPVYSLNGSERRAIRRFLESGCSGAGSPAPIFAAKATVQRFNCLACHSRDGEGGLTSELVEELRRYEKAENAEAVSPPPLTGVGHKLRPAALRGVLTVGQRVRPWMGLRMPQFGEANVGRLSEALAAREGTAADDDVHKVVLNAATIEAGRQIVGKTAFGCISCHDLAGVPNSGTRGPDLALTPQRVRYDWYRRWLEQAQRMQPGTRMPSVFVDGHSTLERLLGGDPDKQAEAMWAYLSLGASLPLPEGMEPPKGLILTVKDRPVFLRTFMPDAGARAIAIGFPRGVSVAFDMATGRLAYAWSGNFLDAAPVWDSRGGNPARVMGPRFWSAPPGCPWAVNQSNDPPDFATLARDPAHGAAVPEGVIYEGPRQYQFEGYTSDHVGRPLFRYRLNAAEPQPVEVTEKMEPLHSPVGVGVSRHFGLDMPANQTGWLLAGETHGQPRLLDAKGNSLPLNLKAVTLELPTVDRVLVMPQGERATVLSADSPAGSVWQLRRVNGTWQTLLRLPTAGAAVKRFVTVNVLVPYRDEPALLRDLFPAK